MTNKTPDVTSSSPSDSAGRLDPAESFEERRIRGLNRLLDDIEALEVDDDGMPIIEGGAS